MFDLEKSIADWRNQMSAAGVNSPQVLDELESHLRDDTERRTRAGSACELAFADAVKLVGDPRILKSEFAKAGNSLFDQWKRLLLLLAGIPETQLAPNMNAPISSVEPRWLTYLRSATFASPAVFLWFFSAIFVLPKANQICQNAGMTLFHDDQAPAFFRGFFPVGQLAMFLTQHVWLIGLAVILVLVLLELRSSGWPRYRRAALGATVFTVNLAVLLCFTMVIIFATIAASTPR